VCLLAGSAGLVLLEQQRDQSSTTRPDPA
jgi:hypothetical protein